MKDNDLTCSNCGEKLLEDDKFCSKCGKKRNDKKIVIGLIALIAVVVIVIGALFLNQENSFSVEVNVGGEVFYLPEGYELIDSIDDEYGTYNMYGNHEGI